jgi:hypothetical protein
MRRASAMIFTALLASGAAVPALAAWEPVGSVDFSFRDTHDATLGNFKGNAVGLTARDSDVRCDRVTATFGNGRSRDIYRGELREGRTVAIDLPGSESSIDRVDFDCRPLDGARASVEIAADTGRYRDYFRYSRPEYPDSYARPYADRDYYGRPPSWDRD